MLPLLLSLLLASPYPAPFAPQPEAATGLTYVDKLVHKETANVATHNLPITGLSPQENDLMVGVLCIDGGGSTAITCPAGWTEWANVTGNVHGALCAKIAGASETDTTWGSVAIQQSISLTALFRNQSTTLTDHESDFDSGVSNSPVSPAAGVNTTSGSIFMRAFCADAGQITLDTGFPTGMLEDITIDESGDGTGSGPASGGIARDQDGDGGARGTATWTDALGSNSPTDDEEYVSFNFEVKE